MPSATIAGVIVKPLAVKRLARHTDDRGCFEELIRVTDGFFSRRVQPVKLLEHVFGRRQGMAHS